jgi:hypothetical protein
MAHLFKSLTHSLCFFYRKGEWKKQGEGGRGGGGGMISKLELLKRAPRVFGLYGEFSTKIKLDKARF